MCSSDLTLSPQNMLFHRNAFTLAVADLELPEGVHFAGRASDKEIGLSMRVVRQYTINNDSIPTRLDVLRLGSALPRTGLPYRILINSIK